jgi:uncharacterized protein YjbI with pentapeptide repeats
MSLHNLLQNIFTNPIINTLFAVLGLIITAAVCRVAVRTHGYFIRETQKNRHILNKNLRDGPFDRQAIKQSTKNYIYPKFYNRDPTQEKDITSPLTVAYGNLFQEVNRFLDQDSGCRHLLILADSGVGKTSFIINYYAYNLRKRKKAHKISLIPLGRKDADSLIAGIPNKKERVVFLDALDEDPKAVSNHCRRIYDLMVACKVFQRVIITCRIRFFSKDDGIPVKTKGIGIAFSAAGKTDIYEFKQLYLAPFDDQDVARYIKQHYHFWSYTHRKKAYELVRKIPQLAARPMLLAHITDIIKAGTVDIETSYQLYQVMVEAWLDRESDRVDKESLRTFCELLAVNLFVNRKSRGEEQATKAELSQLAHQCKVSLKGWEFSDESLLYRNAAGYYKFAHRSIMEFLFVKHWLKGHKPIRQVELTDQMGRFLTETNLREIDLGGVNLSKTDLSGADLRGAELSEAYLSGTNLSGANLSGADLSGADLSKTDLSRGNLCRVNLTGVNLRRADVSRSDLHGANLNGTDLRWTNLSGVDLSGTNLCGANLQKTKIDDTTKIDTKWRLVWKIINHKTKDRNFFKADLSGANLKGINLRGADLYGADLRGADLIRTNLIGANLERADLRETDLSKTNLSGVNHSWMDLSGTNFRRANLCKVNLKGLDLRKIDFSEADLSGADLTQADLRKADLSRVNLSNASLCRADLRGADLLGVNLSKTNLCEADFRGVDFSGVNLNNANLCRADLRRADLRGTDLSETNLNDIKLDNTTKGFKPFNLPAPEAIKQ